MSDEKWDNRELGADENFVAVADSKEADKTDESAGLELISVRLEKSVVQDLKEIAAYHGLMGHQTLIRDVVNSFAIQELRVIRHIAKYGRKDYPM